MRLVLHALPAALGLLVLERSCEAGGGAPAREGDMPVAPGTALHYWVVGAGPDTAIILHGGPGLHARYLRRAFDPLSAHRVLIYYDQRGRGRSTTVSDSVALTAAMDVEDLDSLRRFFKLSRVTLIAHHWGAVLAALYTKRFPDHVTRLLVVSPTFPQASYLYWAATLLKNGPATAAYLEALQARADSTDPRGFCERFWGFLFSPTPVTIPGLVRELAPDMCDATAAALRASWFVNRRVPSSLHGLDLRDTLSALWAPMLVVRGGTDTASAEAARAWARWTSGAREIVLPAPGLFPWWNAPERFRGVAQTFLDGRWPDDSRVPPSPSPSPSPAAQGGTSPGAHRAPS
jgi:proline iminopeptidase